MINSFNYKNQLFATITNDQLSIAVVILLELQLTIKEL